MTQQTSKTAITITIPDAETVAADIYDGCEVVVYLAADDGVVHTYTRRQGADDYPMAARDWETVGIVTSDIWGEGLDADDVAWAIDDALDTLDDELIAVCAAWQTHGECSHEVHAIETAWDDAIVESLNRAADNKVFG